MTTARLEADRVLYQEVQQFYARQMRYLDEGAVREWAATFTEDGVFAANAHPEPQRGRKAIEEGARAAAAKLEADGIQRRHWLGMLDVTETDGTITARTYALIINTPLDGQAAVHVSCSCEDVLIREEGRLKVSRRQVYRDDIRKDG